MDNVTKPQVPNSGPASNAPEKENLPADLTGKTFGDFHVLRRLGQGGMGQVYLAEQISLKRKVALKILRPELAANSTSLQRFKAEAEAVARATHANIVQIYAIGEVSGLNFMALEYVEGRNLREYLEKKGPPEVLIALSILRQVAAALQRAHELGLIHRDIKPENVLLTRKGEVKVADFGLSRCFAEDVPRLNLTQSGVTMGTPLYMSPEQVEGKPVDVRTDIYSLGVTCYHMLSGQPPFRGQTPFEVALQHVQKEPQPLPEIRPDLPAELCALVHKMMAKAPADRLQTCRDILREAGRLRDLLVGVSGRTPPLVSLGPVTSQAGDVIPTRSFPSLPARRQPWRFALAFLVLLLALGGGLLFGWGRQQNLPPWPAPIIPLEEPAPLAKAPPVHAEREAELLKLIKEHTKPGSVLNMMTGLKYSIELGLLYLKDRRLDDADRFFKELERTEQRFRALRALGQLGQAMVLAFKDEPLQSNKQFLMVLPRTKLDKQMGSPLLLDDQPLREMMARALNHNYHNAPQDFPKMLEFLRYPPPPTLKGT